MKMPKTTPEQNKALVLKAFDTLFNQRDYAAAERFWSPDYIQHSAHIEPGREGLFNLIKSLPSGAPVNWIAADVVRIEDGVLVEHWDVIQDEASEEQSKSNAPMFGDAFPTSWSQLI
jgi:predicted SnoaL-like aldol condensation-catalyzing enzyme